MPFFLIQGIQDVSFVATIKVRYTIAHTNCNIIQPHDEVLVGQV